MLVAFVALDLDRREHVSIALGNREMQAKLGRHEMLQLLANRADQGAIGTQILNVVWNCATLRTGLTFTRIGLQRARAARRHLLARLWLDARPGSVRPIHFSSASSP